MVPSMSAAAFVVGACGASAGVSGTALQRPHAAAASCAVLSARQQFYAARVVFDGTMLPGATVRDGHRRVLSSPASVRVIRYLKGQGPRIAGVATAVTRNGSSVVVNGDGIDPLAGERWRVYANDAAQPLARSVCAGTRQLATARSSSRTFSGDGLRFRYPKSWHALRPSYAGTFSVPIVDLSPQVLRQPCVKRRYRRTTTVDCHQPIVRLRPASLLAT